MQTIGERLEEARKKKGISIREAAEATKIRGDYLSKFENNQFDINLTELYVRGFLRTYANFLRLPADRILNDYAALGRGDAKPRQPSREIYGRMDVSIASADEHGDASTTSSVVSDDAAPAPQQPARRAPQVAHRRSAEPSSSGFNIDPALSFKILKWAGLAVVAILLIWGLKVLFSGSSTDRAARQAATPPATATPTAAPAPAADASITLVALDAVRVTVARKNPDNSDGEVLFQGTLLRGQTQIVPKPGAIYITASAAENIEIEFRGKRYPTGFTGYKKIQML